MSDPSTATRRRGRSITTTTGADSYPFVSSSRIIPFVYISFGNFIELQRSSNVQGCASNEHYNICFVVSGACPHSHVCWRGLVVKSRRLETEGSRVGGLLEPASWPCVSAKVKDGSHIVIWTACKSTHNQYETSCGFLPHPRECLYASGSISSLSIGPDYQYQYFHLFRCSLLHVTPVRNPLRHLHAVQGLVCLSLTFIQGYNPGV